MSPCGYACVLCGIPIFSSVTSPSYDWLREYRASKLRLVIWRIEVLTRKVYRNLAGAFFTGVGHYDGSATWLVPFDSSLRWDSVQQESALQQLPVMRQPESDGQHGFILHDVCWRLLLKAGEPLGVPILRLVLVCESLPFPLSFDGVYWGHSYGELLELDDDRAYPWQEWSVHRRGQSKYNIDAYENPLVIPELHAILCHPARPPAGEALARGGDDIFSKLPWELREMIAGFLPTRDALLLRLASRSFLALYWSVVFWASRFTSDGENAFVFEARDKRDAAELLSLYRATRHSLAPPGLRNRQRIWDFAALLVEIARQQCANDDLHLEGQQSESENWIRLAGDEKPRDADDQWSLFDGGCRSISNVILDVPKDLRGLGITTVSLGPLDYVTGIRLIAKGGNDRIAGYTSSSREVIFALEALHGFVTAMGPGGLRALQIVGQGGQSTQWIGRSEGVPKSERLVSRTCVKSLEITIDVSNNRRYYSMPLLIDSWLGI